MPYLIVVLTEIGCTSDYLHSTQNLTKDGSLFYQHKWKWRIPYQLGQKLNRKKERKRRSKPIYSCKIKTEWWKWLRKKDEYSDIKNAVFEELSPSALL